MDTNIDNLKKLLDQVKLIGFWQRLFGWNTIKQQLVDAAADLQKLISGVDNLRTENSNLTSANQGLQKDLRIASDAVISKEGEIQRLNSKLQEAAAKISQLEKDTAAKEATITNATARLNELSTENKVLGESNNNLLRENKRLSTEAATSTETITNIAARITELSVDNKVFAESNSNLSIDNKRLTKENATNVETISNLSIRKNELDIELETLKVKLNNIQEEHKAAKQQNIELLSNEDIKRKKYENDVAALTSIREQIQNERAKEIDDKNSAEIDRLKKLKETWSKHQENVKALIKNICNKHTIEYVDKVPFRGEPDNTLKICDELVIFDSKSPGSDDLTNFPNYLKDQAEKAKKYAKQDNVKIDIFFVVPSNTLEKLTNFVFNLGDHNVYIISVDSLEQIILGLKKIEEYEFAKQLSPEERDNICRVLGKFAHLTKRRIQIDSFFAKQFIELAYKCESDLPPEILEKVVDFEKSEKLNPPVEKRAKAISTKELEKDTVRLKTEAASKGIFIDDLKISAGLNELQLYTAETDPAV